MADHQQDAIGRGRMTTMKRIELLEGDREAQSRVISALVDSSKTFTPEQIAQLRAVMIDVLGAAGLRLDEAEHEDEAREDFRFIRRLRKRVDSAAWQVGMAVILAITSGVIWLIVQGANLWKGQ